MGYIPKGRVYKLVFTDTDYAGLEVKMTGATVGEYLDTLTLQDDIDLTELEQATANNDAPAFIAAMGALHDKVLGVYTTFVSHLISWNVDDADGNHVPETLEGVRTQEKDFIRDIMQAWRTGTVEVNRNLGTPLKNGNSGHPPVSMPMAALPSSPPLQATPSGYSESAKDSGSSPPPS